MDAIGLNPIKLDAIGLDPIRMNAIRLGVPGASSGSGRPYIDPELLSHVKMAISTWGKTNDDPDRAVLKDLSGNGNDMRLLNFGFAEGSGYGLYGTDFSKNWILTNPSTPSVLEKQTITFTRNGHTGGVFFAQIHNSTKVDIPSFKVNVDFYPTNNHPNYYYWDEKGVRQGFPLNKGINVLPANYASKSNDSSLNGSGFHDSFNETVIIEQLPDFEGWLCTDGVDDIIESVKPVSEMLEGSNEITVVSIIHQISTPSTNNYTNVIRTKANSSGISILVGKDTSNGKTGIYGYTIKEGSATIISSILGDKNDYTIKFGNIDANIDSKFFVQGWLLDGNYRELSSVAYSGGFIANKALTTDEINQIIAYFNLDRPGQIIKPQLYCNIKKQGITNDNHAEFNDQLIDFVNGYNIQLNNVAWKGESGIGKYNVDFDSWIPQFNIADSVHTSNKLCVTRIKAPQAILYTRAKVNSMKVEVKGSQSLELFYQYVDKDDNMILLSLQGDGIYDLPASIASANNYYTGFRVSNYTGECDITITQIPENPDALHLDGISDFGKATGLPILKDYTVVADREILNINGYAGILSKAKISGTGAFLLEPTIDGIDIRRTWSFGSSTDNIDIKTNRQILYQSKYVYNQKKINAGTQNDSDTMWIATLRDDSTSFSKVALWSLMLFPYSLSEFLLERQLKKYKAGTLYPDMIEFRPVIKSNIPYSSISYSVNPGVYVAEGSMITITITLSNASDKLIGVSSNAISDISISGDNGVYEVTGKVTKSPQKINIVISSYLTMLGNDTLISNETLIKNE